MKITFVDEQYRSFEADVPADLVGKEGFIVEQVAGKATVQLFQAGIPVGVLFQRLEGSNTWNVRLLGGGGTLRGVAGGAIPQAPAYVKAAAGGTFVAGGSGDKVLGVMLAPLVAAQNDVIEILDDRSVMP